MLARVTGHARAAMEYALKELCEFEGIDTGQRFGEIRPGSTLTRALPTQN
jgi:hypothetical protein